MTAELERRRDRELWSDAEERGLRIENRSFESREDFVGGYWRRPVPLQGPPPEEWSDLEASLDPTACGTCHRPQFEDWRTTIHASAYSPGLSGQLVNWESSNFATVRSCLACHAPLEEQSKRVPARAGGLAENPFYDEAIKADGIVCASCHVRGNTRHGPPRRDGSTGPSPPQAPHGGVVRTGYFEESRFCATCHQFERPAANGKSLQNTFVEWERSRYAEEGVSCQDCHMPDRRHVWRGIHHEETVREGVSVEILRTGPGGDRPGSGGAGTDEGGGTPEDAVVLRLTNTGVGHRFPTYVTPEVELWIELLDASGEPVAGGVETGTIGRRVRSGPRGWTELSDTRVAPDSSFSIRIDPDGRGAVRARGTVVVRPDEFYRQMFAGMLSGALSDTSRTLITEAHEHARSTPFTIFEETIELR